MAMVAVAAAATVYSGWLFAMANRGAAITVDPAQRFQTISGWEVTARLWEEDKAADRFDGSWLQYRPQLMDALVNEIGINRVRIELRSGAENPVDYRSRFAAGTIGYLEFRKHRYEKINDNDDPDTVNTAGYQFAELDYQIDNIAAPMRERLLARGERLFVNLCYVDFNSGDQGSLSHADSAAEYAELVYAAFQHLQDKYGQTPDALEIVLEPENTGHWRGPEIGRAIVAAAARLRAAGFTPQIIAPSTTHAYAAPRYIDAMLEVPGIAGLISTFSYHAYTYAPDLARRAILKRAHAHGADVAMLEHLTGDAAELYQDLTVANVSAWQQYGIAHRDTAGGTDTGGYLMFVDPGRKPDQRIRLGSLTPGLAQYFKHIRSGAVRIGASSDNQRKRPVAFLNPGGELVIVVQSDDAGDLLIFAANPGRYVVTFAPSQGALRPLGEVTAVLNQPLKLRVPGAGVLSVAQIAD